MNFSTVTSLDKQDSSEAYYSYTNSNSSEIRLGFLLQIKDHFFLNIAITMTIFSESQATLMSDKTEENLNKLTENSTQDSFFAQLKYLSKFQIISFTFLSTTHPMQGISFVQYTSFHYDIASFASSSFQLPASKTRLAFHRNHHSRYISRCSITVGHRPCSRPPVALVGGGLLSPCTRGLHRRNLSPSSTLFTRIV